MDPKSLSAMLASVAAGDPSMLLANGNSPLSQFAFGTQSAENLTHNQQVKTPFFINPQQLSAALAVANFKFDNQFSATSPPNNFIAASPLSSISSSLSSGATDASPSSFASLSALSPSNLQQLSKLISPNLDVGSPETSTANSAEVLQRLRGVLAAAVTTNSVLPNVQSPVTYNSMISTAQSDASSSYSSSSNNNNNNDLAFEPHEDNLTGPRRIRRRRPKSPKSAQGAKKSNIPVVEIKQEEPQQMIDDTPITLENSPMDSSMTPGASDSFGNPNEEFAADGQLTASQKICRVCGDHATGYNFNVISCESCKAFFRRNALRPKDFKCPYSGDCEINAVSRRFCQLCRLQKCIRVGMKKEWILNEDQLKRRKNSRLNSLKSVNSNASNEPLSPLQFSAQPTPAQHRTITPISSVTPQPNPLSSLPSLIPRLQSVEEAGIKREPTEFLSQLANCQQQSQAVSQQQPQTVNSQPQSGFVPLQLSSNFANSQYNNSDNNHAALQQILNAASQQQQKSPNFIPLLSQYNRLTMTAGPLLSSLGGQQMNQQFVERPAEQPRFEPTTQSIETNLPMRPTLQQMQSVSMENYNQMVQTTQSSSNFQSAPFNLPPTSLQSNLTELPVNVEASSMPATTINYEQSGVQNMGGSPTDSPQQSSSQLSSPSGGSFMFPPFFDWSPATFRVMEEAIQDEFEACSPEEFEGGPGRIDFKETSYGDSINNYQLNSSELCELDVVRNAYSCMDEPLNDSKDTETLKKKDHNATDVMNIIDIIMRRFVKMTKKLPAFNQISQEGKLALLKSAMIKMVTMRGVTRFDPKRLCWSSSLAGRHNINVSCQIFDKLNNTCQKSKFIRFCYSIHDVIRRNDMVVNLIGLLILFGNTTTIKDERDKIKAQEYHLLYSNLVRRYLESVHTNLAGPIIASIPIMLRELDNINAVAETIFAGKVTDGTRKLPMEFFKTRPDDMPPNSQTIVNGLNQPTSSA